MRNTLLTFLEEKGGLQRGWDGRYGRFRCVLRKPASVENCRVFNGDILQTFYLTYSDIGYIIVLASF